MDWDKAIEAHLTWKTRLRHFINGTGTETLVSTAVSRDDGCELGKWLKAHQQEHGGDVEFDTLAAEHTKFHTSAGAIVEAMEHNRREEALTKLNDGLGTFSRVSTSVIMRIRRFRNKVGVG